MKYRKIAPAAVVAALALTASACSDSPGAAKDESGTHTVTFGCTPAFSGLPRMVAESEGIAENLGLRFECSTIANGPEVTAALISGDILTTQLAPGNVSPLLDQGQEVAVYANFSQVETFQLLVRKDYPLPNADEGWKGVMKDLEGAKVGVPALGGAAEFLTRGIFEQAGMDQESATLMATQQSAMLSSLDGQQIDAAWVTEPSVTMGVESGIAVQPFTVGGDDGPPDMKWGSMGLVAARKFVEEDPEPFCKVKQAYQEAVDFIRDPANKDAVVEVMTAEMNLEPAMAEAVLDRNEDLYFPESIDVSAERYDPAFAFLGEMGIAKKSYTTDDYAMEVCT